MDKSLKLKGNNYNIAVMVFTLAYVVFGVTANLVFKTVGPKSLSFMMLFWGCCAMGQGLVHNFAGLAALRLLMGIFEVGHAAWSSRHALLTTYTGRFCPRLRLPHWQLLQEG